LLLQCGALFLSALLSAKSILVKIDWQNEKIDQSDLFEKSFVSFWPGSSSCKNIMSPQLLNQDYA
jgi:hypothetical protein